MFGGALDADDLRMARAWFAGKCRICQRPMHETDVRRGRCRWCDADNSRPEVVAGTVVADSGELEEARRAEYERGQAEQREMLRRAHERQVAAAEAANARRLQELGRAIYGGVPAPGTPPA